MRADCVRRLDQDGSARYAVCALCGTHSEKQPRLSRAALCLLLLVCLALPGEGCARARGDTSSGDSQAWTDHWPLTLILVGDVMLGRGVAQALDGDWEAAFAGVHPWLGGQGEARSVVLANLESPLTALPQVRVGYDLRAPPEAVAALRVAGIDAVSLANNHALDAGEAGLRETASTLRGAGIVPWMAATPAAMAQAPEVIGLAFDDSVIPLDIEAARAAVAERAAQADVVVVSIHWGAEYQATPSARQQAIASALSQAGASVIAGHGPHVLQPIEWVGETLVAYSLGNFLFDQPYPLDCRWGAILRVTLEDGRIVKVEATPTVAEQGRVRHADGEMSTAIVERLGLRGQRD
jgi:poly-gamma-glutamate capsule biosynthesis protein CapA/YwtB (metallophosphatase superfamily)